MVREGEWGGEEGRREGREGEDGWDGDGEEGEEEVFVSLSFTL
jgi:hypothetical protein